MNDTDVIGKEDLMMNGRRFCVAMVVLLTGTTAAVVMAGAPGMPVGGGILDAGLRGEYFDNPRLDGRPRFVRKDIRVRFEWGELLPILGSRAEDLKNFPHDNFSVRWTGQIVARFGETYALKLRSDDAARLSVKPADGETWQVVIDPQMLGASRVATGSYQFAANRPYDVRLEYRHRTGPARVELRWSSPSTPEEALDSASVAALAGTDVEGTWGADAFRCLSPWGSKNWKNANPKDGKDLPDDQFDEDHWPRCDARVQWFNDLYPGRYLLEFDGQAAVSFGGPGYKVAFRVGDKEYGAKLPVGAGYNSATNVTRAFCDLDGKGRAGQFAFTQTRRDGHSPEQSGIRAVRFWRPLAPGSKEHHAPGTSVCRTHEWMNNYVNLRFYRMLGHEPKTPATWEGRCRPAMDDRMRRRGCLEDYILCCNELGRDLYVNIQTGDPTPEFLHNLALALRYGTDGREPYDRPVAHPEYPPLNSNLRVYLEFMNECVWNYGGISEGIARAKAADDADWKILTYDGPDKHTSHRWMGVKIVQISNAFREVFGDAAMGDRVRVQLFGQYELAWQWFPIAQFIDDYYNNANGQQHVKDPHPVNYYLWGGGGACYYSCSNPRGRMENSPLCDGDFESPKLAAGEAALRPVGTAWTFTGPGGICDFLPPLRSAMTVRKPGGAVSVTSGDWVGVKFTVGDKPLYVPLLGTAVEKPHGKAAKGQKPGKNALGIAILNERGDSLTGKLMSGFEDDGFVWMRSGWISAALADRPKPIRLEAGETYYLVFDPASLNVVATGEDTDLQAGEGLSIEGAVRTRRDGRCFQTPTVVRAGACGFAPASFRYTDQPLRTPEGEVGMPPNNEPMGRWIADVEPGGNPQCQVYVFENYPVIGKDGSAKDQWESRWLSADYTRGKATFEKVVQGLSARFPDKKPVRIIPVGEVMYQLHLKMKAGKVPGYQHIADLYADGVHLKSEGKYLEAVTHYAVVFQDDPHGAIISGLRFWKGPYGVDPAFAQIVWDTAWQVVTSDPLTGIKPAK